MEIRFRPCYEEVPFKEIAIGEVFKFSTNYYMRIEQEDSSSFDAVNLVTGGVSDFLDNEIVAPIDNCYLAIE